MPRIRKVEITNFRGIQEFSWCPSAGINCLIGPGDSGKSSVLDAIDLCVGARRTVQFTDADFHRLDVMKPIRISLTIGELDDALKTMEGYGMFLRGFKAATGEVEDEPERDAETVLTLTLIVAGDLEPSWTLESERAAAQNLTRNLNWADRARIAPPGLALSVITISGGVAARSSIVYQKNGRMPRPRSRKQHATHGPRSVTVPKSNSARL